MTTAHRPTWAPAKGGEEQGGSRFYAPSKMRSVKDIAGFTKMKERQIGQGSIEELHQKNLLSELEEKEKKHFSKTSKEEFLAEKEQDLRLLESNVPINHSGESGGRAPVLVPKDVDADDVDDDDDNETDEESDSDDDEAELLAELERIKQERAEAQAREAAEHAAEEEERFQAEVRSGNPLLHNKLAAGNVANFTLKRRWDDDVVFRNQARNEPKQQRRFINDTIRNDFHRRFLDRYMR